MVIAVVEMAGVAEVAVVVVRIEAVASVTTKALRTVVGITTEALKGVITALIIVVTPSIRNVLERESHEPGYLSGNFQQRGRPGMGINVAVQVTRHAAKAASVKRAQKSGNISQMLPLFCLLRLYVRLCDITLRCRDVKPDAR